MSEHQYNSRVRLPTVLSVCLLGLMASSIPESSAATQDTILPRRWLYLQTSLWPEAHMTETLTLLERVASEGYNGVVFADFKFMRWDDVSDEYRAHWRQMREACTKLKLDLVAGVMPIGYSNGLLSRDPNLAEGIPVKNAAFIVRNGKLSPEDSHPLINGGFEMDRRDSPAGWAFVDEPGRITFLDTAVHHGGNASLRMQEVARYEPEHRHARACQTLKLQPFHYYHVSAFIKTQDWEGDDTRIMVMGESGRRLSFQSLQLNRTQDWTHYHVDFNTLESSEVKLYLGTWAGNTGSIWWDDVQVEPAGFINILRRAGTPVRLTNADGSVEYVEGRDYPPLHDPRLGMEPWAGDYTAWHDLPSFPIPSGSRLTEGQRVLASYYHAAIVNEGQMTCCMSEPKVYEILTEQARQVREAIHPDGYMMMHDEIRVQGWDESCERRHLTPAQILADNMRQCVRILQEADPGKPMYVWSDMFDPHHNARKTGPYYLVKGDGPWYGSWEGLPKEVTIVNWQMGGKTRRDTMLHFSRLGHHQILAGYYDGSPDMISGWLKDAQGISGLDGVMYTTWQHNFSQTGAFLQATKLDGGN